MRKMKLYRQGRFEVAPAVSFTLLDEYQRQILFGARVNYNLTDWLAIGVWGAAGPLKLSTKLAEDIEDVETQRRGIDPGATDRRYRLLTQKNIGPEFTKQLSTIDWAVAPQVTVVPFRGKIALFQSIYADSDLYFFVGPAFIGVKERADCTGTNCNASNANAFDMKSRVAIAPTFGLGFSFYVNKWNALGFEWRGLPFARNTGGFDNRGSGPDKNFPDGNVDSEDREFKFNQMITVTYGFYFPTAHRTSE